MTGKSGFSLDRSAFMQAFSRSAPFLAAEAMALEHETATRIVARAKVLAPVGDESDPHAGRLRDDISIKDEGPTHIDIGTTMPEGFLQEYGTFDQHPQPFMRPAIAEEGAV